MFYRLCGLAISLLCSTSAISQDIEQHDNVSDASATPITSLSSLHSLKNLKEIRVHAPKVHDLHNKHQVRSLFVQSDQLPILNIQLSFNAGSARDASITTQGFGTANMAARLLPEGTSTLSSVEVAEQLAKLGAQLSIQSHRDMFVIRLRSLSDEYALQSALKIILTLIQDAQFETKHLNRLIKNTELGQKQLQERPSSLMDIRFYRAIYAQHPYAHPITGYQSSLSKISQQNLIDFRQRFLVRENLNIAITGQITPKQALAISNQISQAIPSGQAVAKLPIPKTKQGFDIQHLPYNATQAHIVMGHLGLTRDHPDRLALEVANAILGGSGFNALLTKALRIKRGYTYSVNSVMTFPQSRGVFKITYSTQQEQLIESIAIAHRTLIDFIQNPIDPELLAETKAGLLRNHPNRYSSNAMINSQIAAIGFNQQSANELAQYPEQIQALTAADIQNAVRRHLHPQHLSLIIVSKTLDKTALEKRLKNNLHDFQPISSPHSEQEDEILPWLPPDRHAAT